MYNVFVLKTLLYLSAHAQMNSTHAHFNISAREIGAILDFFVVGCCCGLEFFDIFLLNDSKNSCKATKTENSSEK